MSGVRPKESFRFRESDPRSVHPDSMMLTYARDLFRLCDSGILLRRRRCLPVRAVAWIANRQTPESLALSASLFDATDNDLIHFPRPSTSERIMVEPTLSETFEEDHIVTSFHCVSQSQVHSVNFLLGLHALGVLAATFLTEMGVIALPAAAPDPHGIEERFSRVSARLSH